MCDYRYGFLRCEDGGLDLVQQAPDWAMWCPKCNGPKMLADALSSSLIAFQQALQLCVSVSPEAAYQWISWAKWPAQTDAGAWLGPQTVTREQARAMLNDAMQASGQGQMIEIAAVSNELESVQREIVMHLGEAPWRNQVMITLGRCRERLNDLTKPKEHA